ncbi:MAG: hypothetical protein ACYS0D_02875 [Planctomycetota bacterium]|jgi:hypothetical protein
MFLNKLALGVGAGALLLTQSGFALDDDPMPSYTGARIRVSQETAPGLGDFNANVLGYLLPFQTKYACDHFYGYDANGETSYGGCYITFTLDKNRSHLFMADTADGMSLIVIHDRENDPNGGSAEMILELFGDLDGAYRAVEDDEGDYYIGAPGATYFEFSNSWGTCCTDGFIMSGLDGTWTMFLEFADVDDPWGSLALSGINNWRAFSGDGSEIEMVLAHGQRVRLDLIPDCPADVNEDGRVSTADLLELLASWGECF